MSNVFVWATGQDDNLGDSALRRGYLDALRGVGHLTVWRGPASDGFLTGLGLQPQDRQTGSYRTWYARALSSALRRRTFVAVNAGEVPVSRMGAVRMTSLFFLILAARVRGGGGLWYGAGVPNPAQDRKLAIPYRAVAVVSRGVRVRERTSRAVVGYRKLMPDWAFGLGTPVSDWAPLAERPLITLVLRGDRGEPSAEWVTWFTKLAEQLSLKPTVVVQVGRDYRLAQSLSTAVASDYHAWFVDDHAEHEATVREIYGRSAVIVSDRLHALIFGATEGAVPIGWVETSKGKLRSHFDSVGMYWVGAHEGEVPGVVPSVRELTELSSRLGDSITECRAQLGAVVDELPR